MIVQCRARVSQFCEHGANADREHSVDDGSWDGHTIICTACYITIGMPGVDVSRGRKAALEHMNKVLESYKRRREEQGI